MIDRRRDRNFYASAWKVEADADADTEVEQRRRPYAQVDGWRPDYDPGRRPRLGAGPTRADDELAPGKRSLVEAEWMGPGSVSDIPGKITLTQRMAPPGGRIAARGHDGRSADDRPAILDEIAARARRASTGAALPSELAARLGAEVGHRVDHARVHADAEADELARILGVRAFTLGADIFFGAGEYAPGTDGGDRLLRHELTHVAQHDRGLLASSGVELAAESSHVEVEARAAESPRAHGHAAAPVHAAPVHAAPVHAAPVHAAPADAANTLAAARKPAAAAATPAPLATVIDLQGESTFEPTADVAAHIDAGGAQGAAVRVAFGKLSRGGIIRVRKQGKRYVTVEDKPQVVPLSHPLFAALPGFSPVLVVHIGAKKANAITGFAAPSATLARAGDFMKLVRDHADILGLVGFHLPDPSLTNELRDGSLQLATAQPIHFELGGWVQGDLSIDGTDGATMIDAQADLAIRGLGNGHIAIQRNEQGHIAGEATLDAQLGDRFTGTVTARYEHGDVGVHGTLRYDSEKFKGEVTVIVDQVDKCEQVVRGAIDPLGMMQATATDAPAGKAKKAKKGERGVAGFGSLDFAFTDWLTGKALVAFGPTGYITVLGKIAPPKRYDLMKQPRGIHKTIIDGYRVEAHYGIPHLADAHIGIKVGLSADANLGPIYMDGLEINGVYSTDPSVMNAFSISGALHAQAYAGLSLNVEGYGGLTLAKHEVNIGAGITGKAGVQAYAEARPTLGYREVADPSAGKKGEYYLKGHLEMAARPVLGLEGYLFVELDSPWWSPLPDKKWPWQIGSLEYPLGGSMGVAADVDYVLGSDKWPEVKLSEAAFDPGKFVDTMMDDQLPAKSGGEPQGKGGWTQPAVPAPTAPPPALQPKPVAAPKAPTGGSRKRGKGRQTADEQANIPANREVGDRWMAGMEALGALHKKAEKDPETSTEIHHDLDKLKSQYGFTQLTAHRSGDVWLVDAAMNPKTDKPVTVKADPKETGTEKDGKNSDAKSDDQAHKKALEDAAMAEGKAAVTGHLKPDVVAATLEASMATACATSDALRQAVKADFVKALGKDPQFDSSVEPARNEAVKKAQQEGFNDFSTGAVVRGSNLERLLHAALESLIGKSGDATRRRDGHVAGAVKRRAGVDALYDHEIKAAATLRAMRAAYEPTLQKAMKAFLDKHSVTDSSLQHDLRGYADAAGEEALEELLASERDLVMRKLAALASVKKELETIALAIWDEAVKTWVDDTVHAAWNPRTTLIERAKVSRHADKHLKADSRESAVSASTGGKPAQYWPNDDATYEHLLRDTLITGDWEREGTTVHAYKTYSGTFIGFDGGVETSRHRAELTASDPPVMHGHPRIA